MAIDDNADERQVSNQVRDGVAGLVYGVGLFVPLS